MIERKNGRASARAGCDGQGGVRLTVGIRNDGWFGRGHRIHGGRSRIWANSRVGFFFNANQARIRNLPAEVAVLAALLEILLEEDRTAGISDESSGSGQKDIPSAILHLHTTPEKG